MALVVPTALPLAHGPRQPGSPSPVPCGARESLGEPPTLGNLLDGWGKYGTVPTETPRQGTTLQKPQSPICPPVFLIETDFQISVPLSPHCVDERPASRGDNPMSPSAGRNLAWRGNSGPEKTWFRSCWPRQRCRLRQALCGDSHTYLGLWELNMINLV